MRHARRSSVTPTLNPSGHGEHALGRGRARAASWPDSSPASPRGTTSRNLRLRENHSVSACDFPAATTGENTPVATARCGGPEVGELRRTYCCTSYCGRACVSLGPSGNVITMYEHVFA